MNFSASEIDAAYAHCESVVRGHYENFPVASLLLHRRVRRHVAAIYAFARRADDFADEPAYEGRRLELIADWRRRLEEAACGTADHPVFVALSDTIRTRGLPVEPLRDLLDAFEQDVRVSSYETFDDLLAYCRLSADPVGRLVLHLSEHTDEKLLSQSDSICTGLQLANFWQDLSLDLDKGRCYIPREDLRRFRGSEDQVAARVASPAFIDLMRFQVSRTRALLARGAGLPSQVGGRLGFELKLVLLGGMRILDMIEKARYDVFSRRPSLRPPDWGRLLLRAALATSP